MRKNRNFKNIQAVLHQVSSEELLQPFGKTPYELRSPAEKTFIDKLNAQVNRPYVAVSVPFIVLAPTPVGQTPSGRCPRRDAIEAIFSSLKPEHLKTRTKGKVLKVTQEQDEAIPDAVKEASDGGSPQSAAKPRAAYAAFEYEFQFTDSVYAVEFLEVGQTEEEKRLVKKGQAAVLFCLTAGCYVIGIKKSDGKAIRPNKRTAPAEPTSPATSTESGGTARSVRRTASQSSHTPPQSATTELWQPGQPNATPPRVRAAALPFESILDSPSLASLFTGAEHAYSGTDLVMEVTSPPVPRVARRRTARRAYLQGTHSPAGLDSVEMNTAMDKLLNDTELDRLWNVQCQSSGRVLVQNPPVLAKDMHRSCNMHLRKVRRFRYPPQPVEKPNSLGTRIVNTGAKVFAVIAALAVTAIAFVATGAAIGAAMEPGAEFATIAENQTAAGTTMTTVLEASEMAIEGSALITATVAVVRAAARELIFLALCNVISAALGITRTDGTGTLSDLQYFCMGALSAEEYARRLVNLLRIRIGACGGAVLGTLLLAPIVGPLFASLLGGIVGSKVVAFYGIFDPVKGLPTGAHANQCVP